jgi:hypothetical protein
VELKAEHDAVLHGKHAKKKRAIGRAKIRQADKAGVAGRRQFKKQTQSGE